MYSNKSYDDIFSSKCDEQARLILKEKITSYYPFVNVTTIGKSVLNRPIECFSIGDKEKTVLFCGAFHGMEWITSFLLYLFIININETIINPKLNFRDKIFQCLSKKSIAIIPCVNPDGVEISINGSESAGKLKNMVEYISKGDTKHWQSNAYGVDINHNFNAGWHKVKENEKAMGIILPSKTRYGGKSPENQAETKTMTKFCRTHKLTSAFAFHSQGEEIYWDYGAKTPPQSKAIADTIAKLSGYTVSTPEKIATGGGFKDWVIDELKIPAFTIEVGKGKNPLDISQLMPIYQKIENMLFYMLNCT